MNIMDENKMSNKRKELLDLEMWSKHILYLLIFMLVGFISMLSYYAGTRDAIRGPECVKKAIRVIHEFEDKGICVCDWSINLIDL